jgi:DNA invertase Pin-like site-specific DNA recombinase
MENDIQYIAYLRVSTQKQGFSGLGLEAQKEIIQNFLYDKNPIAEYIEVESGRKTDKGRPKLKEALEVCRKTGAKLIVAKLDRLARNVAFLSQLLESDVDIVFCDFPQANKMVLHILAAISQYEAELVATRTKQALAAKKARGAVLGNPDHLLENLDSAIAKSVETNKRKAEENPNNKRAAAMLKVLAKEGKTLQEMADYLNEQGFTTSKGYKFTRSAVLVLLKRNNIERITKTNDL